MAVLNTSFLIALERGDPTAWARLEALQAKAEPLRIPAAAWVEYLFPMTHEARVKATEILDGATIFEPITRQLADEAARLQHELRRAGKSLGWHDPHVAKTAQHHNEPVVTTDTAFHQVPGLVVLMH